MKRAFKKFWYDIKQATVMWLLRKICYADLLALDKADNAVEVLRGDVLIVNSHSVGNAGVKIEKDFGEVVATRHQTVYIRLFRRAK